MKSVHAQKFFRDPKFVHFGHFWAFLTLMRGLVIKSAADRPETSRNEFYASGLPSYRKDLNLHWTGNQSSIGATTRLLEIRKVENAEKSIFADAWLGYGIFLIFFPIFPASAPIRPITYPNFIQIGKLDLEIVGVQGAPRY